MSGSNTSQLRYVTVRDARTLRILTCVADLKQSAADETA